MDLAELAILGDDVASHWYYRSKASAVLRYVTPGVRSCILDVGAGCGFFAKYLLENTAAGEAVCVDTGYPGDRDESVNGKPLRFRRSCGTVDVGLVLMMDVLEHVEDDVGLLAEYAAKVPSGTEFLITVPAFPFLWSEHDVFLNHKRRYTLPALRGRVAAADLEVVAISYYFGAVFPFAAVQRLLRRASRPGGAQPRNHLRRHLPVTNWLLLQLCRLEQPLLRWNRVAGLSVFCLARKR